ncbi:ATP-grasp domain-containing protein [candidate division CSSED10-310 bacterium]|uniref:ATP-grasp domain-containing protein n=1 Tax=candidate division CSSED10-310 bacterium TaxID=2855610 RepID=A0ABV6Z680_UNCC1
MMALYVILDPNFEYAAYMTKFLQEYDYQGIAVFTSEAKYRIYHSIYAQIIGECIEDEYLSTEFPGLEELADDIMQKYGEELQGIIPWDEATIELGAELGEMLEFDWNSRELITHFRNKYALKDFLRRNTDLRINASQIVTTVEEVEEFVATVAMWPIVVKPTEGSGSRGVYFADDLDSLMAYSVEVLKTAQGEILLEEFIGGQEYVVNGITNSEGDVLITDLWCYDKRDSHGFKNLYFQTIKVDRADEDFDELTYYAASVIQNLGLRKSPFHMELKQDAWGPCLVECGARFAGGNQPLLASMLHDHSLFEIAATHYIGDFPFSHDDVHYDKYDQLQARIIKGVQSFEIPAIKNIHGLDEVQNLPSFYMIGYIRPIGSYLPVTVDLDTASYEIYLIHEDPEQIESDAEMVRGLIRFE